MPEAPVPDVPVSAPTAVTRRWIDLLLVAAGTVLALQGVAVVGVPIVVVGLILPLLEWRTRRAGGIEHLLLLVPPDLAEAHRTVLTAADRPGVIDPEDVVALADELVLEVATVLGGRPARRASQRRFVAVRKSALESMATELSERHEAWRAAMQELDDLVPVDRADLPVAPQKPEPGSGWLSTVLLVVLAPAFLVVDLVRGTGRAVVALVEGVALRLRTIVDLLAAGIRAVGRAIARALRSWRHITASIREAARASRGRFVAARTLALRRLRSRPRALSRR